MTAPEDIALFTVECIPAERYIGAVGAWARAEDLAEAEAQAFDSLRRQASELGADAVIGLRIETTHEVFVGSRSPALGTLVFVESSAMQRVYVSGTAVLRPSHVPPEDAARRSGRMRSDGRA